MIPEWFACGTLQAFQAMSKGDKQAMANYNGQQVKQLTRLIEVTRTDLPKVSPCLSLRPQKHTRTACRRCQVCCE